MWNHVTLRQYKYLAAEWKKVPPLPLMVAAFMGYKAEEPSSPAVLLDMFPDGKIGG